MITETCFISFYHVHFNKITFSVLYCSVFFLAETSHTECLPERNHIAQFGGQAAELIGRQVQVDQVGQLGDVWRDAGQVVIVDVQCSEVGERP